MQAAERIQQNLSAASSSQVQKNFEALSKISKNVVANGGAFQVHPLGYWTTSGGKTDLILVWKGKKAVKASCDHKQQHIREMNLQVWMCVSIIFCYPSFKSVIGTEQLWKKNASLQLY